MPIFKIQIAQIKATMLLITEENGLEVSGYIVGVILHLALANQMAYHHTLLKLPSRLAYHQNPPWAEDYIKKHV